MTIVESPQQYVRPLYQYMEGFDVEDYLDADAHTSTSHRMDSNTGADDMTAESSTHTYESGVQETVTLRRGPATPHDCALLKITYSDGEIADCYVNTAWLRDRADQLADTPRPLTHDDIEQLVTQNRCRVADTIRALYPEEPMATDVLAHAVMTALTEPTRPEEKVEAVLHQYWSGDINGDDLANRIVEEMNR